MNKAINDPNFPCRAIWTVQRGTLVGELTSRLRCLIICLLLSGSIPAPLSAETDAASRPVSAQFGYIGDLLHNASGGIRNGSAYLQNVDAVFTFDLRRIIGSGGGSLFAYLLWNNASTFSDRYSGDTQVVSNIDAEQAFRLYEFWYQHPFTEGLNLKIGLYDLNSEFDAVDSAAWFLNGSHGIVPTYSQTGERGPSIFPATSLAGRLEWKAGNNLVRYALLDAVPGDPDNPSATAVKLSSNEGVLHALEYNHNLSDALRLGFGAFLYSAEFEAIRETSAGGNPARRDGNAGWYGFAEGPVYNDATLGRTASAFVRYGTANGALNPFDRYFGAGMMMSGFVPRRPDDEIGISMAMARCGMVYRAAAGAERHETAFELTYVLPITDRLQIQPDLQYILNPGADPDLENAMVLGIRLELNHGFHHR
ncbi:MAG: carbohydrate porin [Gemmatimonadota bacterium]|nr:carbohydrate porin [Gemmatimonadota bacterium]